MDRSKGETTRQEWLERSRRQIEARRQRMIQELELLREGRVISDEMTLPQIIEALKTAEIN